MESVICHFYFYIYRKKDQIIQNYHWKELYNVLSARLSMSACNADWMTATPNNVYTSRCVLFTDQNPVHNAEANENPIEGGLW